MTASKNGTMTGLAISVVKNEDNISDYGDFGSDAEEIEIIHELLASIDPVDRDEGRAASFVVTDIEDYEPPTGILLPKIALETRPSALQTPSDTRLEVLRNIETDNPDSRQSESPEADALQPHPGAESTAQPDTRSPLERFRKPPKKPLSVTDLVSPAWCELQYYYVLSKHGRKRRTPAMKQGTVVHKALEEEIHITVPVETVKQEDSWGLRIWNICQGLKTLRDTGRTRELEIWGTIGGELVNGIIDELSFECPDPKYEESLKTKDAKLVELPEYQTSITEALLAKPSAAPTNGIGSQQRNWIYITDVKTRMTATLPTGSSLRPTIAQLHLYHHMLENLIQGNFRLDQLTERYKLDPGETFSDTFIAQLGTLNQDSVSELSYSSAETHLLSSQGSMDVLLEHNTLTSLWQYMVALFQEVFLPPQDCQPKSMTEPALSQQSMSDLPPPPAQPTRLSPLLTASYMLATPRRGINSEADTANQILGHKSFQFNSAFLHAYLSETLPWWRGEREAKGVILQEAWKCRSCDFKGECAWIQDRDKQAFDEAMERKKMREMAGVKNKDMIRTATSRSHV